MKKRGISNEQVTLCAIDRNDNIITELLCKGRMNHEDLIRLFTGKIEKNAIICTDSHKSFIGFAHDFKLEHIQIKRGIHREGTYHIQHINSYHSRLKSWMSRFNGVATKYLANYLYWHKWLELFDTEKEPIKGKEFIVHSSSVRIDTKISDFRTRQRVFV